MNIKFAVYLMIVIVSTAVTGCGSAARVHQVDLSDLPASYPERESATTSAALNWKYVFNDSHLQQLIDTALNRNFDVLAAMQRIEATRAQISAAKGRMLPSVDARMALSQNRYGLYTMDGAGNADTNIEQDRPVPVHLPDYHLGIQSSWEVDIWGRMKNLRSGALARFAVSLEGRNLIVTNLVADVASAYYELVSLDVRREILQETISLQENALTLVRVQKETGVTNELAVEQFEAQLLSMQALKKEVDQEIRDVEVRISLLLGRYPDTIPRTTEAFYTESVLNPQVGIPSELLRYRPDVRQAEHEVMAASADVRAARAALLPSFNITGDFGLQAYRTPLLFTTPESFAYTVLGGVTAPLINRKAIKAEFASAKASELESIYNYQKAILNGYLEVHREMANIRSLQEVLELKSQQAQRLRKSVETSNALFRSRRATYVEVILAQASALEAQLELIDVKRRHHLSHIALYKALGGGWSE